MSSLVTQIQSNISTANTVQQTANSAKTINKNQNNSVLKNIAYASFASIPIMTAGGVWYGNDAFIKEKDKAQSTLDNLLEKNLYTKEFEFKSNILSKFSDLVLRIKEDRPTDMPNCLMVVGKDPDYCDRMINWIGKTGNADFVTIKVGDGILEHLEKAEENFQKTKNWTLLYVKNMEKLIDHNQVKDRIVEGMKDIMSAASEDYHTTMIFSTADPLKLDKIALQTHRVRHKFLIDEINETKFWQNEELMKNTEAANKKLQEILKSKNNMIKKYAIIGLAAGTVITAVVNVIPQILKNKNNK